MAAESSRVYKLPSLGRILHWCVDATCGISKRQDETGRLRKLTDRLRDDAAIDPSAFVRVQEHVIERADYWTRGFVDHWLSGNTFRDVLSAYQFLATVIDTTSADACALAEGLLREFLGWIARKLWIWWDYRSCPGLYSSQELWFADDSGEGWRAPQSRLVGLLRECSGSEHASNSKLAKYILRVLGSEPSENSIRATMRQVKAWEHADQSISALLIDDIARGIDKEEGNLDSLPTKGDVVREAYFVVTFVSALDTLSAQFFPEACSRPPGHWLFVDVILNEKDLLGAIPQELFNVPSRSRLSWSGQKDYFSKYVLPQLGQARSDAADNVRSAVNEIFETANAGSWSYGTVVAKLRRMAEDAEYSSGPLFVEALRAILRHQHDKHAIINSAEDIDWARSKAHVHGLAAVGPKANRPWSAAQFALHGIYSSCFGDVPNPTLGTVALASVQTHAVTDQEIEKLYDYRQDRIDEFVRKSPFRRTRLMMAVGVGHYDLAHELLAEGAKPCLQAVARGKQRGDNGTALLFCIQRHKAHYLHGDLSQWVATRRLIEAMLDIAGTPASCIDVASKVKNYTCLGEAISSTDPWIVEAILDAGAGIERNTGGDELSPLYLVLSEISHIVVRDSLGPIGFLQDRWERASLNLSRMLLPPPFDSMTEDEMRSTHLRLLSDPVFADAAVNAILNQRPDSPGDLDRLCRIAELLLSRGANPDSKQPNGFTPLGFCREIAETSPIGERVAEMLRNAGATVTEP